MAVRRAIGISRQRHSGYRPSRVNIMAQGLSTPNPYLSPTHLSIRRDRATTTHYTHHQVSLVVSCSTTLVPSLGLCIGPACKAGVISGMQKERVSPQIRKKERKKSRATVALAYENGLKGRFPRCCMQRNGWNTCNTCWSCDADQKKLQHAQCIHMKNARIESVASCVSCVFRLFDCKPCICCIACVAYDSLETVCRPMSRPL